MSLEEYFSAPYGNMVWVYNSIVTIDDFKTKSFKEILSHKNANGRSIALEIHEAIVKAVGPMKNQTVLDVGAKFGHFSYLMAEDGARAIAVEKDTLPSQVISEIARIKNYDIDVFNGKIERHQTFSGIDLCLMLNVFDHLLRDNEETAIKTLKRISADIPKMALMMGPHPTVGTIPEYIVEHSRYNTWKELLHASYGDRALYLFEEAFP